MLVHMVPMVPTPMLLPMVLTPMLPWSSHNRWEFDTGLVVTSETGLDHTGSVINNNVFFRLPFCSIVFLND